MIEWIPVLLVTFKLLVLGIGMFYAIKWHYDQGKKDKDKKKETRAVLRAAGKVIIIFALLLACLGYATLELGTMFGLDLNL